MAFEILAFLKAIFFTCCVLFELETFPHDRPD
jgi:hypothetical protein